MWRKLSVVVLVVFALALALAPSPPRSQAAGPAGALQAAGGPGSPAQSAWSSGWVALQPNNPVVLTHGLGGDPSDYAVQYWFRDTDGNYGIHTRAYGGLESDGRYYGALWRKLTAADVEVTRYSGDLDTDQVRIAIWFPEQAPDYCSDWTYLVAGTSQTFSHNLGGDPLNYVVSLWFKGPTAYGINQQGYGGMEVLGNERGAWWHGLTATSVTVTRGANDLGPSQYVRPCITVADPPAYDSGWVEVNAGATKTLAHNLGGQVDHYVVHMDFQDTDPSGIGIHQRDMGGNAIGALMTGAAWQKLTNSGIEVYRYADDVRTDRLRVRIWRRPTSVYLPCVLRSD